MASDAQVALEAAARCTGEGHGNEYAVKLKADAFLKWLRDNS